jgi:hypothetical protein
VEAAVADQDACELHRATLYYVLPLRSRAGAHAGPQPTGD